MKNFRAITLKTALLASCAALAAVASSSAVAARPDPEMSPLTICLADSTSGKDRKELAKWTYLAMSSHPEIRSVSGVAPGAVDESNRVVGAMLTRLIGTDCADETRAEFTVSDENGTRAMNEAFTALGKLAVRELMNNGDVQRSLSGYMKYIDVNKMTRAMPGKR